MPEHRRRGSAPSPPPWFNAILPPPANPDPHITPSKDRPSPLNLSGRFSFAAGDRRRWNLAGTSQPLCADEPRTQLQ
jgi:hypothetical protein